MAWIRTVPEAEATGLVKAAYDEDRQEKGWVGGTCKALSLKPELMPVWRQLAKAVAFGGTRLGRRREELISVVCNAAQECSY